MLQICKHSLVTCTCVSRCVSWPVTRCRAEHLYSPESLSVRLVSSSTREWENSPEESCRLLLERSSVPSTFSQDKAVYRCLLAVQVRWRSPASLGSSLWLTLKPLGTSGEHQVEMWGDTPSLLQVSILSGVWIQDRRFDPAFFGNLWQQCSMAIVVKSSEWNTVKKLFIYFSHLKLPVETAREFPDGR